MFSKFFNWLNKKYRGESKKNFGKFEAEVDNANGINIDVNANMKTDCEIVKNFTVNDNINNVNNVNNDSVIKDSFTKEKLTKDLFNARKKLSSMREKYYAVNIAGRIIKKVLDNGIAAVQSRGIVLGDLGDLGDWVFIDFGKIYRLKGLKFMQKGVIVESGIIEKFGSVGSNGKRNRSWEINISVPEFYEVGYCRDNDGRNNESNANFKVIRWEERNIVDEFRKEIESVMNCEYEQNFKVINRGVCKFISDEGLVRKIVREVIWEEFGWNESEVKGENLSDKNFGKVFFPKTGEWVDVKGKCEDVDSEFIGDVCREIIEGVKKFGVGRERFGVENNGHNLSNKNYRRLIINIKIRKGEVWGSDNLNGVRNRWEDLRKDVKEVIGSVGKEKFFDMARKTSELMKYVEEKYGIEKVEEIRREVENGNRRIRECRREIEGIVGADEGYWDDDVNSEDMEDVEKAMLKMEETVGEIQERLREVMGEEIWEMYRGIIGEE